MKFWLATTLSLSLHACATSPEYLAQEAVAKSVTLTAAGAQAYLANTTVRYWSRPHGTQIEFLAGNGKSYLWYPGNKVVVAGEWKVEDAGRWRKICFRYGLKTYNPSTHESGGDWSCEDVYYYMLLRFQMVNGDPFQLAGGRTPFVIPKQESISIASLAEQEGVSPTVLNWKSGQSQPH